MATIDLKHATVTIRDGTATPNELEIKVGEGNLTYTEKRNMEYRRDRGNLDTVRQGDEEPVEVNFDFEWEFLRSDGAEPVTPEEALKKTGAASAWVSSSADACEPYAVDIVVEYIPPCGTAKSEVIVLQDFRWETLDHNLKDGQISAKGQCNVTEALVTRVAQGGMIAPPPGEVSTADSGKAAASAPPVGRTTNVGRDRTNPRQRALQLRNMEPPKEETPAEETAA